MMKTEEAIKATFEIENKIQRIHDRNQDFFEIQDNLCCGEIERLCTLIRSFIINAKC